MLRTNFIPVLEKSDFVERTSMKPVPDFVPGQAIKLSVLIDRFEKGQRLGVHENFKPLSNFTEGSVYMEDFDDAPPDDVHDIVDVEAYYREHEETKRAQQAAKPAKPAKQDTTPQKDPDPEPDDPAH